MYKREFVKEKRSNIGNLHKKISMRWKNTSKEFWDIVECYCCCCAQWPLTIVRKKSSRVRINSFVEEKMIENKKWLSSFKTENMSNQKRQKRQWEKVKKNCVRELLFVHLYDVPMRVLVIYFIAIICMNFSISFYFPFRWLSICLGSVPSNHWCKWFKIFSTNNVY